jgi:hypothetical protein
VLDERLTVAGSFCSGEEHDEAVDEFNTAGCFSVPGEHDGLCSDEHLNAAQIFCSRRTPKLTVLSTNALAAVRQA